jgi:putative tryptophan/tyrosine transport system substrate-binding protein
MIARTLVAAVIALAVSASAAPAAAQPPAKPARVALLCTTRCEGPTHDAFVQGLRELGRVEGVNLVLDTRAAGGQYDRLPALAAELLAARPDVIVASAPQGVRAVKDATSTVPIVMVSVADPVLIGLVPSLARPGGNLTGLATLPARGFIAKQLELLKELLPHASRIAVLWNSKNEIHRANLHEELPPAAERLGIRLQLIDVRDARELEAAFDSAVRGQAEGLLAVGDPIFHRPMARLPELALRARLPAVYLDSEVARTGGGLLAYGPDFVEMLRRAALYVDRILKGAKPADMPIEQPSKFLLVVNQRTAKALGLTVPPALLLRANEIVP